MNKESLVFFFIFLSLSSLVSAQVYYLTLNGETPGTERYLDNGQTFWKVEVAGQNKEFSILVSPNFVVTKSSVAPVREVDLSSSYLFGLLVSYKGKELYFNSEEPILIEYKKMDNVDKFNNFFSLVR